MNQHRLIFDKMAIGLSLLCSIHCLLLPVILVWLPMLLGLNLQDEAFHFWMIFLVIPISAIALTQGCRDHLRYSVLVLGGVGLLCLVLALVIGHDLFGEVGEKGLTLLGSSLIVAAHIANYRLCRRLDCHCEQEPLA